MEAWIRKIGSLRQGNLNEGFEHTRNRGRRYRQAVMEDHPVERSLVTRYGTKDGECPWPGTYLRQRQPNRRKDAQFFGHRLDDRLCGSLPDPQNDRLSVGSTRWRRVGRSENKPLTGGTQSAHSLSIAAHQRYGFGSPEYRRTIRQHRWFFYVRRHGAQFWVAVWGAFTLAGTCTRSSNPHGLPSPFGSGGRRNYHSLYRSITMPKIPGAPLRQSPLFPRLDRFTLAGIEARVCIEPTLSECLAHRDPVVNVRDGLPADDALTLARLVGSSLIPVFSPVADVSATIEKATLPRAEMRTTGGAA
jgi:hypothetical protein